MNRHILGVILALLIFCPAAATATNPFLTAPKKEDTKVAKQTIRYPAPLQKVLKTLSETQRRLHERMSHFARRLKSDPSANTLLLLFAVAFSYGVIHAMGPGHGKAFAVSYFISEKAAVKKGVFLGGLIAGLHAGTSIVLVLIIYGVVSKTVLMHVENTTRTISLISYAMITLVGLVLLCLRIRHKTHHGTDAHSPDSVPGAGSNKSLISVALAAGMVPCPGTILLLIFSISLDMLPLGILLALAIAIGMAVTIALAAIAAIISRKLLLEIILHTQKKRLMLSHGLELAGCIAIVLLGGTLFLSSL
jgi:nickel/cobalt exporter